MDFDLRNIMGNFVSSRLPRREPGFAGSLFLPGGRRKYLTQAERQRVLAVFERLPRHHALFARTLAWTGARPSEVLALTPEAFDLPGGTVAIETLKRRRFTVREVPLPPTLIQELDAAFDLAAAQHDPLRATRRLWPFSRTTAWRIVKAAMEEAGLSGLPACPRGLRHGFGVGALQAGVPVTQLQRWLGHARLSTTAIYAEISGPEERLLAGRYWRWSARRRA